MEILCNKKSKEIVVEVKNEKEDLTPNYYSTFFGKIFFNYSRYTIKAENKNPWKISDFKGISNKDKSKPL